MFLASLLRRIAFSYYDYKAYNFNIEKTDFVVIHIPDQIGDAMAIFPVIRALELHKIKHLLIVTSTINLEVFNVLKLEQTKLTLVTMTMQDHATLKEIKDLGKVRISTLRNENETFSQLNSITYIGVFLRLVTYSHLP